MELIVVSFVGTVALIFGQAVTLLAERLRKPSRPSSLRRFFTEHRDAGLPIAAAFCQNNT